MLRTVQFIFGMLLLIALEVFKVYFIMPFPGSQQAETVGLAYFIHTNIFWFRTIGLLIILFPLVHFFMYGRLGAKILVAFGLIVYAAIFYAFNYRFLAEKMFYQPKRKTFTYASESKVPMNALIVGITHNGKAKAYPLEIIGYHHQVRDTIGDLPVMVTYCTVCRTGRVFSPEVDGKPENFRLVGMDHFNAMFEDETTKSWWRQASGEAVAGPLKGQMLKEIFSEQMSLRAWLELHPMSEILQQDSTFKQDYKDLEGFGTGTIKSGLIGRDSLSWKEKSWVVGVELENFSRAYDWNDLVKSRMIHDTLHGKRILILLQSDSTTFHVFNRDSLDFFVEPNGNLTDTKTNSQWNWRGQSIDGAMQGSSLPVIQSYQEFWHSWRTFHPQTSQFKMLEK